MRLFNLAHKVSKWWSQYSNIEGQVPNPSLLTYVILLDMIRLLLILSFTLVVMVKDEFYRIKS